MSATFFTSQPEFHRWLEKNHDEARELLIGFYTTSSKIPGLTYKEALDEALCFGWIDGVRKNIDATSYSIRFSPRKKKSNWSMVNIKRINELIKLGLVQPSGMKTFKERDPNMENRYSFEQKHHKLETSHEKMFRKNKTAWKFFTAQAPSYQKAAIWWVEQAKQEETKLRRLEQLMTASKKEKRMR